MRRALSFLFVLAVLGVSYAQETLKPSFPNHAAVFPKPRLDSRDSTTGPINPGPPFSWTQTVVVKENSPNTHYISAYDPGSQPLTFELLTTTPQYLNINSFNATYGIINSKTLPNTGGQTEAVLFQVTARDVTNPVPFSVLYDIRAKTDRLRGMPHLLSSPGAVIQPGQIVRYTWNQTSANERFPKCEALLSGLSGPATGLGIDHLTGIMAVKVQPLVLGYYLMLVTPRDVLGEPPLGSTSNGLVFLCAFGSQALPPVTEGLAADTFLPAAGQTITIQPVAVDPQTGRTVFDNQTYDFGDSTVLAGISGPATYAYAAPGIYTVRCTVVSDEGLSAVAQDNVIVGATILPKLNFKFFKSILPAEAGAGDPNIDNLTTVFKGVAAGAGDRIVFVYNRNRFGRMSDVDAGDDTDIVLGPGGVFTGATRLAKSFTVQGGAKSLAISITRAQFDMTGDPRFGRADLKGIFKNQRIAVCVVPADGSTPRVCAYTGNMRIRVKGGAIGLSAFVPELSVSGSATTKEPNPKQQEVY